MALKSYVHLHGFYFSEPTKRELFLAYEWKVITLLIKWSTGKCFDLLSDSLNWVWENVWRSVWRICMWILGYLRWWIHKMKLQQILHSQWLEKENHIGQVCSLNFWHCGYQELIFVGTLGKQTEALAENKTNQRTCDQISVCCKERKRTRLYGENFSRLDGSLTYLSYPGGAKV